MENEVVSFLLSVTFGFGVHIHPKGDMERFLQGPCDATSTIEAFDPREHILVATQPTMLNTYGRNGPERVDLLGPNARVVTHHLKSSVLWYE